MTHNILEILILLCYANLFALTLSQDESAYDESDRIFFIKRANKRICVGVQLSNEWILTLGDCIEQGALHKYKAVQQNRPKTRPILEERRSPDGGSLVLLRREVTSTPETKERYSGLAKSTILDNFEHFHTYRYNDKEMFEAVSIELVKKQRSVGTDVAAKCVKGQNTCYKLKSGDSNICLPGLPAFGSVRKKVTLQGLSNTASDACDTVFQATTAVAPVRGWLLQQLKDCGYPRVKNGKATLDEPFFTTSGATASVSCNNGYASETDTLTCKDSGEWEKTKCVFTGNFKLVPRTLSQDKSASDESEWIFFIKRANKRICAGVQLSNEWILTLGDCIEQGALHKYKAVQQNRPKTRPIHEERRSPDGGFLVLLRIEVTSTPETKTRYSGLARSTILDNFEQFHTYRYNDKEVFEAISIEFVKKQRCLRTDIAGKFGRGQHMCYKFKSGDSDICLPGLPAFGSVGRKLVLQGLSCTAADACDTLFQATAAVAPVRGWLLQQIKDCGYPRVKNGEATLDEPFLTTFGATASVSCNKGYASRTDTLTCKDSGEWEKTKCILRDCGPPPILKNGKVVLDVPDTSTVGATASVTCSELFTTVTKSIACKSNGLWEKPKCRFIDCGSLPSVANGDVNLDTKKSVIYSTATVSCDLGFLANSSSIICQDSGMWEVPACTALKECGSLSEITNGYMVLRDSSDTFVGSIADVYCDVGYKPSRPEVVCKDSGTWEKQSCIIKDCGSPPSFPGVSITLDSTTTTFNSTATVICDGGFFPNQSSIICDEKGRWEIPRCNIKDCGPPPKLENGSVDLDSTTTEFDSTASVTCDIGYETNQTSISCLKSGLWEVPTCTIKDCGFIPSVNNGSLELDTTTTVYGSTATLSCSSGFYTNKTSVVCQESGRWESSTCTIKDCGALPSLDNGLLTLSAGTTYGSFASVTCNSGYSGDKETITCKSTGSWTIATCEIKDCGSPPSLPDGSVTLDSTTTTFNSTATVVCNRGFFTNQPSITCNEKGKWDVPRCYIKDCGTLPKIRNGSVYLDSTTTEFNSTASVTCNIGYETNQTSISCLDSGLWEVPTCTIKDCGSLPFVRNGSVVLDSTTTVYGSTATLSCSSGFYTNQTLIVCQESGRWETSTCTIKDCGPPPKLRNGSVYLDSTTTEFDSTASVTCDTGYETNHTSISCLKSGLWEVPTCTIKDCGYLPSVSDGSLDLDSSTTVYGSTATLSCSSGFYTNKTSIVCQESGRWEASTCTIKDCGPPPKLRNGSVYLDSTTTEFDSTASVTCDTGYETNHTSISCLKSGLWEVPTCTIKDCGFLPSVSDGSLDLDSSTTVYGSTATLSCSSGFYTNKTSIVCQESGRWEASTCTIKDCGSLLSLSNGDISLDSTTTTFGSTATVNCNEGYEASTSQITCQSTGVWEVPTCRIIDCGQLPSLQNGLLTLSAGTTYGSSASVTCNNGYSGDKKTITCKSTGSWAIATCTIRDCGSLPSLNGGTLSLDSNTTTFGSTASVNCSTGYYANENTISCNATGSWDTPTCTIQDCGALASLADGSLTLDSSTTTYGSTATATCDAGYDASKSSISCKANGAWQTTKCVIRDCGSKPSVKNGSTQLDSSTTTVGSTVTVTCTSGYSASKTSLFCKKSGSWSKTKCFKD